MRFVLGLHLLLSSLSVFASTYNTEETELTGKTIVIQTQESNVTMTYSKEIPYDCKQKFLDPKSGMLNSNSWAVKSKIEFSICM
jgi:hypothetical protein